MSAPSVIPANERERPTALAPYRVLGTAPDAVFDEVVRLTAKLFSVPIALVQLVDEGSVWFKASFGLAGAEWMARNESICSVAIRHDDTTVQRPNGQALPPERRQHTVVAIFPTSLNPLGQARVGQLPITGFLNKPLAKEQVTALLAQHFAAR